MNTGNTRASALSPAQSAPLADDLADPNLKVPHIGWNSLDI